MTWWPSVEDATIDDAALEGIPSEEVTCPESDRDVSNVTGSTGAGLPK